MKKAIISVLGILLLSSFCFAETVYLKSGKTIEGKILEKTDKYVKIDFEGVVLTYYLDEIAKIVQKAGIDSQAKQMNVDKISAQTEIKKEYYPGGQLKSEKPFKDGKIEGMVKLYYENGRLKNEVSYKNDEPDGVYKGYDENGNLQLEGKHVKGKRDGLEKSYYPNGAVKTETPFKDGIVDGVMKNYYENGNLRTEVPMMNGKEDGIAKGYYKNGPLERIRPYQNGLTNGIEEIYDENGRLLEKRYYVQGNRDTEENFKKNANSLLGENSKNNSVKMEQYINEEYKFMINKPMDWIVIDDERNKEILNTFGSSGPDDRMICVFVKEKNPDLMPSINIGIQKQENSMDSYFNNLERLKTDLTKSGLSVIDGPRILEIAGKKAIYYNGTMVQPGSDKPFTNETYWFFHDGRIFIVSALAFSEEQSSYKNIFQDAVSSIKFFGKENYKNAPGEVRANGAFRQSS